MTDLFDQDHTPAAIRHRRNTAGTTNTPDIIFTGAPRLNILAMSNLDWYLAHLKDGDARGGFLARFLPVELHSTPRCVPFVKESNKESWRQLQSKFINLARLTGAADISAFYYDHDNSPYAKWYRETKERWDSKGEVVGVFFKRWRAFVLKLAVIFEMSRSCSLKVSLESFERAVAWLRKTETTVFQLERDGFSAVGLRIKRRIQYFKNVGAAGVTLADYKRHYRGDDKSWQRDEDIKLLLECQYTFKVPAHIGADGRNLPEAFVHADFVSKGN